MNKEQVKNQIKDIVSKSGSKGIVFLTDGKLKSSIFAAAAKEVLGDNIKPLFIAINQETTYKRNYLRLINLIGVKQLSFNITEEYEALIKKMFEIEDPYASLEIHEHFEKTGEIIPDTSYLQNPNLKDMEEYAKNSIIEAMLDAHAIMEDYTMVESDFIDYVINFRGEELIELAKEFNIPQMIIDTGMES